MGALLQMGYFYLNGIHTESVRTGDIDPLHLRWALLLSQIFTFLIPALAFSWLLFKQRMWNFWGFGNSLKPFWILASLLMLVFLLPVIQFSYELNQDLPLPSWMTSMEADATATLETILEMNSLKHLIVNLFLIALLPALGEEFIFRGILQQFGYRVFKNPTFSVWVTALLFSAIHFQFEGFIPRFILGVYLGYLFYWTRNLIIPILAHFFNNALMIVASYLNPEMVSQLEETPMPDMPWYSLVISTGLLVPLFLYFKRGHRMDATQINPENL